MNIINRISFMTELTFELDDQNLIAPISHSMYTNGCNNKETMKLNILAGKGQ